MADEPIVSTTLKRKALKWNGTNQAQIAGLLAGYAFVSVGGSGELNFTINGNPWTVALDGWIHYDGFAAIYDVNHTDAVFNEVYEINALASDLPDVSSMGTTIGELETAVEDLETAVAGVAKSVGFLTATIAIGNSNVDVPLVTAMPDTEFTAEAQFFGSLGVGGLTVNGALTVLDESTVRVPVANSGLALLATVVVLATVD